MRSRGLEPGKEVSLVGYDNVQKRGELPPGCEGLTSVDNPADLVGHRLGELLMNQILHSQRRVVHERIPVTLVVRQSTGPCPTWP